jgi:hypothetical protein
MKRDIVVKLGIQTIATCFGLLGLVSAWGGVSFLVIGMRDSDRSLLFFMPPFFLALGGIGIAVAWQALRRFGPTAIRNVVGFFMFLAWSTLAWFPESSQHSDPRWRSDLLEAALVLGPLCLAFLLYRILSRKLIQMMGTLASDDGLGSTTNMDKEGSRPDPGEDERNS